MWNGVTRKIPPHARGSCPSATLGYRRLMSCKHLALAYWSLGTKAIVKDVQITVFLNQRSPKWPWILHNLYKQSPPPPCALLKWNELSRFSRTGALSLCMAHANHKLHSFSVIFRLVTKIWYDPRFCPTLVRPWEGMSSPIRDSIPDVLNQEFEPWCPPKSGIWLLQSSSQIRDAKPDVLLYQ